MSLGIGIADDDEMRRRLEQARMAKERTIPEISGPSSHGGWPGAIVYGAAQAIGKGADMVGKAWKGELSPQEAAEGSFDVATAGIGGPSGALMAGGSKTLPLIKEALPGLQKAYEPIRAYHGSPHDFDRFDISKIGTGEGAQAYGHGLYFAENEGVARSYKEALSRDKDRLLDSGKTVPSWIAGTLEAGGLPQVRADFEQRLAENLKELETSSQPWNVQSRVENVKNILSALDDYEKGAQFKKPGHMYEVAIQADPEHFLDWDKPLSEQSSHVRDALKKPLPNPTWSGERETYSRYPTDWSRFDQHQGGEFYRHLSGDQGGKDMASGVLAKQGIPGIKYLDQGSRAAGEGSRNYVAFSDELIKIARKYGIPLGVLGGFGAMGGIKEPKGDLRA